MVDAVAVGLVVAEANPQYLHMVLTMLDQPSSDQHTSRNKGTASFCSRHKEIASFCSRQKDHPAFAARQ